ncbi:hypothetical protein [Streptomyces flavidovirens]|uniref:hypothetical protein n=1 Tax=Streptomyces flavidovirens TaxID=67298 RepID=UPI00040C9198|nr:hypothetical protein [Streptomyces flavidovirens]
MAGHAAIPDRSRRPVSPSGQESTEPTGAGAGSGSDSGVRRHRGIVPVVLGAVYGMYASFLARDAGPVTGWNVGFGVLCAVVVAALCFLLGRTEGALIPLVRAAAYGALFGVAIGFLHSLAGNSILDSVIVGGATGAGLGAAAFYVFYTRE